MCDKPLRSACVLARKRHADCGAVVGHLVDLAADRVTRPAVAIAPWITVLNHEIRHDPMNGDVSIIIALGKLNEVVDGKGGRFGEKFNSKRTLAGSHDGAHISSDAAERACVISSGVARMYGADLR